MRRARRAILVVAVLLVVGVVTIARMYVWPAQPRAGDLDAVVMLSGDHGERLPLALRLVRADTARVLVLAGTPDSVDAVRLCEGGEPFEVVCLRPEPDNTRAEARATGVLAAARGWKRIAVVTSTYHLPRARLLFQRCVDADVVGFGGRPPYGTRMALRQVFREAAGTLYIATMTRTC